MDNKKLEGYKNHIFGLSVESMFDHKCRELGLETRTPHKQECWDRTVLSPSGEFKVQIKATRTLSRSNRGNGVRRWQYAVSGKREDMNETRFAADTVDFIAIYVAPQSRWFILPASVANCARIRISQNPKGRMGEALGRWERLGAQRIVKID